MNIAIEDIRYLENYFNEKPTEGDVWKLAQQGYTTWEIFDKLSVEKPWIKGDKNENT